MPPLMSIRWFESESLLSTGVDLERHIETVAFYSERSSDSADAIAKVLVELDPSRDFNPIVTAAKNDQYFAAQREILRRIKAAIPAEENVHNVSWRVLKSVPVKPIESSTPEEYTIWLLVDEISKKFVILLQTDSEEYNALQADLKSQDEKLLAVDGLDEKAPKSWHEYNKIVELLGLNEAPRYRILSLVRDVMEREWAGRPLTASQVQQ